MSWSSVVEEFSRPSPKDGYYDVFISFRGADTRSGFTDTLYRSLLENELYTFIDADLAGNVIETLFKIIRRSRMAVVVYSESFASSHWCLRELEAIIQRWEEKKMLMIPIFYKVDAHELKHPSEKITKYFDEHITKYGKTIVENWKASVTKMGYVSGFPYKDVYTRSERDFITTQVITTIKKKLREWGKTGLESSTSNPYNSGPAATENHHDVFVSFLGKDTRYDLVSHLYKALMNYRKDIKIFMEDRDHLKDDKIFKVIQRSKMSVIVFSKNYASSKWCLRELVRILQYSNTMGHELLPIFYEQADNERIAYYLEKHERDEELETVQNWRDAITELDYTVGWRYSTTKSETGELENLIQRVVEEISTILNRVDEKKESTMNQQAKMSAKEENTQVLAVETYLRDMAERLPAAGTAGSGTESGGGPPRDIYGSDRIASNGDDETSLRLQVCTSNGHHQQDGENGIGTGTDQGRLKGEAAQARALGHKIRRDGHGNAQVDTEWMEKYADGVYVTLVALPDGTRDIKRVRFSRRRFVEHQADTWWSENRRRVYEKYNVPESD